MGTCSCEFDPEAPARFDQLADLFRCTRCLLRVVCIHDNPAVMCCRSEDMPDDNDAWVALGEFRRGDYLGCPQYCCGEAA